MTRWIAWGALLVAAPAQGATWTYRAPVPTTAPADGSGFALCLDLPARLEIASATVTSGGVSLTCASTEEGTSLCYEVHEPWPTEWTPLTCEGATDVVLRFVPAFDPTDAVLDGVTVSPHVDEVAASFSLPPGVWPNQTYEGTRGTVCRVKDARLWVWREGTSRRKGLCEIRARDGTAHRFNVRFGRVR